MTQSAVQRPTTQTGTS